MYKQRVFSESIAIKSEKIVFDSYSFPKNL